MLKYLMPRMLSGHLTGTGAVDDQPNGSASKYFGNRTYRATPLYALQKV